MSKVRTKSGWLGDEVGTWVSYDDYKKLEAQLDAVRTGCDWTADDMDNSYWESSCGGSWEFNDGGVQDNGLKYCPFCSGKIIEALNGEDDG